MKDRENLLAVKVMGSKIPSMAKDGLKHLKLIENHIREPFKKLLKLVEEAEERRLHKTKHLRISVSKTRNSGKEAFF